MAEAPLGSSILELYRLGSRDYVNGLTLFEESLKAYERLRGARPSYVKKFQVNRWVRSDARIDIYERSAVRGRGRSADVCVRLDLVAADREETVLLTALPDRPVTAVLEDYDRGLYLDKCEETPEGGTSATFSKARITGTLDLMRGVVEANHRHCVRAAQGFGVKKQAVAWAYLKNCPFLTDDEARQVDSVEFLPRSAFRAYGQHYMIRDFGLSARPSSDLSEICFFFPMPTE